VSLLLMIQSQSIKILSYFSKKSFFLLFDYPRCSTYLRSNPLEF
jgi:hypothetical protein